ncbi:enoyl-CoA hydratase/isomerase family protein [Hydrogenophaga taeniospiralis]|uniref:enoyl-CoA hydratase/isomerase family protein n=1 Tax=Hydrogenophaga taeniospiralis TaxID=65656 RepID=UPI001CFA0B28|nr:enoyl-CoA hydratase/isomerase family protein [Hydrogenophaga taeniospiralis]MCB4365545.1 enoyl-CoA hydratase/isomerase family protein [Hydrogenophaga taeniospiralis]
MSVRFEEIPTGCGRRFGRATLSSPGTLNALSLDMIDRLAPQLTQWANDPRIALVVLDAEGDRAFCAGGDLQQLYASMRSTPTDEVPSQAASFFEREYRLDYQIHTYPKPILCWGNGIVMGGGIGLLAGASHRVVTPSTRLAMPEISIGLYPDVGGSWFLRRAPGKIGLFLALTGASFNGTDARFVGLADFVLPHEQHGAVLAAIAAGHWLDEGEQNAARLSHLLREHALCEGEAQSKLRQHYDLIDQTIGHDSLADIAGRLQRLAEHEDPWLAKGAETFMRGSPTSAALSFALWQRVLHLSLADVLRLEYHVSVACARFGDFAEGIRALIIDKDRNPRWKPATLAEVTPIYMQSFISSPHPLADLA